MRVKSESEITQSCPTLSDPMDYSPPGSSIHGIFQARVLELCAIAFSVEYHWYSDICWWQSRVLQANAQELDYLALKLIFHHLLLLLSCFSHVQLCATPATP